MSEREYTAEAAEPTAAPHRRPLVRKVMRSLNTVLGVLALGYLLAVPCPSTCSCTPLTHPGDILLPMHDGRLELFHPEAGTFEDFADLGPGYGHLTGIARASTGDFLLCDAWVPRIMRLNPETGDTTLVSQGGLLVRPMDLAMGKDGYLYEADWSYAIVRVDPVAGGQTAVGGLPWAFGPSGLAVAPDGDVYVANLVFPASIARIDVHTGAQSFVTSGKSLFNPGSLAFRPDGSLVVANGVGSSSELLHIDLETGDQTLLASAGAVFPWALAFGRSGHAIVAGYGYPSAPQRGVVVEIDLATGTSSTLVDMPGEEFQCMYVFPGDSSVPVLKSTWGRIKAERR